MKYELVTNVQTTMDLQPWETGRAILSELFSEKQLSPQKIATFGEVSSKHGVEVEGVDDCRPYWGTKASLDVEGTKISVLEGFYWKRARTAKSLGMVTFPSSNMRGIRMEGGVFFQSEYKSGVDWLQIFRTWIQVANPFAGMLHPFLSHDGPKIRARDSLYPSLKEEILSQAWSRYLEGAFHCQFRAGEMNTFVSGFTNLGWASWFGHDHAKEVEEATIRAAGFPIEKIGDGYLIQVTEDISDVVNDFAHFSNRRAQLKALFHENLFLIKDEPNWL